MANDSITAVLAIVAWGTKLTFGLYDFSIANACAPATEDVNRLAKEVNLLSQVLRQIGSRLKEDSSLPSQDATNTVTQIIEQCQNVFREIESMIPLGQGSRHSSQSGSPQMSVVTISPRREELEWNARSQARAQYLLTHLESLKLTLSVMLQTLYTAKTAIWAKLHNTPTAYEAIVVERSQMEVLVIEQQLALARAYRMHDAFRRQVANAPLLLGQSTQSQAITNRDEYGPNPRALMPYQESTLARTQPPVNETEALLKVRMISSPYVELLLSRWTRINAIEKQLQLDLPPEERQQEIFERRNWQAPAVESDSEGEDEGRRPPKLHLATGEPVLMHVNESRSVSSPMSAGQRPGLQPPGGSFSPQSFGSRSSTSGSYFPQTTRDGVRPRASPGPSPLSSPRTSFSSDTIPQRPQTAFKADQPRVPRRPPIPWRIRVNQWYWDYHDADLVYSTTRMSPASAMKTVSKDTIPITEVFQEHVSREAIRKRGYEYTKVKRNRTTNGRKNEELCYCVEGALRFEEVARLVDLTLRIRNPNTNANENASRSPRTSRGGPVMPPPLDPPLSRSATAPVNGNKFRDSQARELEFRNPSNASNTSDEDAGYKASRTKSHSSRRDSGTYEDKGSSKTRKEREKSKGSKGSTKAQTLNNIAAGVGLATLLDGLPEILSYL